MFTLHLGVIDSLYAPPDAPKPKRLAAPSKGRKTAPKLIAQTPSQTTGDVAEILERKYNIMEIFFELNQQTISDSIAESMADALDTLLRTSAPPVSVFPKEGQPEIQKAFNDFIDLRKMDGIVPGVPTAAAKAGVNHRLKSKKGSERPSFKDTGAYEGAFRAWVD